MFRILSSVMSKYDELPPRAMGRSRACSEMVSCNRAPKRVAFSVIVLRLIPDIAGRVRDRERGQNEQTSVSDARESESRPDARPTPSYARSDLTLIGINHTKKFSVRA